MSAGYGVLLAAAGPALERLERERHRAVDRPATSEAVRALLEEGSLERPLSFEAALAHAVEVLTRFGVQTASPRHFGWFNPTPLPESAVADLLVSAANPQLAVWAQSPAAVEAERQLIARFNERFGLPRDAGGVFTSGGSEASLTATIVALTRKLPGYAEAGLFGLDARPVFYASAEAHHSLEKIAHATGLGRGALRLVPTDDALRLDVTELRAAIEADLRAGHRPFMVVGTAGTTRAGSIDPLHALADLCEEHALFLHVDAAWGGAVAISDRLRPILAGIERADSITFDPHKLLGAPLGTGLLLVRDAAALGDAFRVSADYVLDTTLDPYLRSLPWSRRFTGLRLLLPLWVHSFRGLAERLEHQVDMARRLSKMLRASGFRVEHESALPVVCFVAPGLDRAGHERVAARVNGSGDAWITTTKLAGRCVLRACICSYETSAEDLEALLGALSLAKGES